MTREDDIYASGAEPSSDAFNLDEHFLLCPVPAAELISTPNQIKIRDI